MIHNNATIYSKAWLIVHLKLVDGGDRAVPRHVGIYSESAETLTRAVGMESVAVLMSAIGKNYGEAKENLLKHIACDIRLRAHDSEYRWVLPLMNESDAEAVNDILENIDADDHCHYELEGAGSQPKPR
jgi:hypothetical protein